MLVYHGHMHHGLVHVFCKLDRWWSTMHEHMERDLPLQAPMICTQAGVAAHGSVDHELWLQYAAFEQKHLKGAGSVYWRAVKALAEPDAFVTTYCGRSSTA